MQKDLEESKYIISRNNKILLRVFGTWKFEHEWII